MFIQSKALAAIMITALIVSGCGAKGPKAETKLTYSDDYKKIIQDIAQKTNIKTIYIPQIGFEGDRVLQTGIEYPKMASITYPSFAIKESLEELKPTGNVAETKKVSLKSGPAQWVKVGNTWELYLHPTDTYVVISSDKPLAQTELQKVADSLEPLK